ncbi:MAG TPA: cysteine desulfurase-like protein [Thermoanaerobaculia bacterium]|nr:cysteine desulfurase-like protein [Thermoanaerobaculia bacterium]
MSTAMPLDVSAIRDQYPALAGGAVFFDNPGGTQVPQSVLDAVLGTLRDSNANLGGAFATSRAADDSVEAARAAVADLLGAQTPGEVVFGANMTTLTFALARALGRRLGPGDELVVTRLDHDANIAPWLTVAEDRGCVVRWLDFDPSDCTLRLDQLDDVLGSRTRLVALGWASNAVGTVNPVHRIVERAKSVGALTFIDAVQLAPHRLVDVQALGCDFLAASAYKFFGPHVGALWGRYELLDELVPYKVRPASDEPPGSFETGTLNHEGIAGAGAAVDYLADLSSLPRSAPRRRRLEQAFETMCAYESRLGRQLIEVLESTPGVRVYGLTTAERDADRVPTVAFTMAGRTPREVAAALGERRIHVWDGHYYALEVVRRLGLDQSGGMVRVGLAHYNTAEEVARLGEALQAIASARAAGG